MTKGFSICPHCGVSHSSRTMKKHKEQCANNSERASTKLKYLNPMLENGLDIKITKYTGKQHRSKAIYDDFFKKIKYWVAQSYLSINLFEMFETVKPRFSFEDDCLVIRYKLVKDNE